MRESLYFISINLPLLPHLFIYIWFGDVHFNSMTLWRVSALHIRASADVAEKSNALMSCREFRIAAVTLHVAWKELEVKHLAPSFMSLTCEYILNGDSTMMEAAKSRTLVYVLVWFCAAWWLQKVRVLLCCILHWTLHRTICEYQPQSPATTPAACWQQWYATIKSHKSLWRWSWVLV